MKIAYEDLLLIRKVAAENGRELTPQEIINILQTIKPDLQIDKCPGLVTLLRQLERK